MIESGKYYSLSFSKINEEYKEKQAGICFITKENNNFMVGVRGRELTEQNPEMQSQGLVSFFPFLKGLET